MPDIFERKPVSTEVPTSAVGTPGPDMSGVKIAEALGGAGDAALDSIIKVRQYKQEVADTAAANKRGVEFDLQAEQMRQQIHQKFQGSGRPINEENEELRVSLDKLHQQENGKIKSEGERRLFNTQALQTIKTRRMAGLNAANQRQTGEAFNNTMSSINTISNSISNIFAQTDLTDQEKMQEMAIKISQAKSILESSKGVLDGTNYQTLSRGISKAIPKAAVLGAMQTDPNLAEALLHSNEFDAYLNPKEKEELLTKTRTVQKQMLELSKVKQAEVERDNLMATTKEFLSGELTFSKLEEAVTGGQITPEVAGAFEVALFNPKEWDELKDDPKYQAEKGSVLVNMMQDMQKKNDISKVVLRSVTAYNKKQIETKDLAWILNAANEKINDQDNPKWEWLDQAVDAVSLVAGPASIPKFATRLSQAFQSMGNEVDPREIAKEVIKDTAKTNNPELAGLNDVPNAKFERGKQKVVYPWNTDLKADGNASDQGDFVIVQLPNGKVGPIPKEKLSKALERGAKIVQA